MLIALCDFWFNSSTFLRWNCPWITGTHLKRSECLSVAKHNRFKTSVSNLIHLFCSLEQYAGIFLLYCGIEHKSGAYLLVSFQDEIALFVKNYEPFYGLIHEENPLSQIRCIAFITIKYKENCITCSPKLWTSRFCFITLNFIRSKLFFSRLIV